MREEEGADVAYDMLRALRRILRRVALHSKFLRREAGLTLPQILCLMAISQKGEATSAEISRAVQLSAPTVTGIIDRLERDGLVRRERGTSDRRKVYLSLSEEGKKRAASLPTPLQEQFVTRVMLLEAEERQLLLRSLERIVELMEAEKIDAAPTLVSEADIDHR